MYMHVCRFPRRQVPGARPREEAEPAALPGRLLQVFILFIFIIYLFIKAKQSNVVTSECKQSRLPHDGENF